MIEYRTAILKWNKIELIQLVLNSILVAKRFCWNKQVCAVIHKLAHQLGLKKNCVFRVTRPNLQKCPYPTIFRCQFLSDCEFYIISIKNHFLNVTQTNILRIHAEKNMIK